jgi:hypothetical protein
VQQTRFVLSLFARAVRSTVMVDRGYRLFNRLRSKIVLACASDAFYDVYNDLTFACQDVYRAETETFRSSLFPFEERAISQHFPSPPGSVLVGAAGGGREVLALARRGYQMVAFEPAQPLAISMVRACSKLRVEAYVGRYEGLPFLSSPAQPSVVIDLRSRAPFEAAIMGWGSLSHLRSDELCIETLRQIGRLTTGPILVSWLPRFAGDSSAAAIPQFSMDIGYFRRFSGAEVRALAECAGLEVVHLDDKDNWPHAILRTPTTRAST